MHQAYCLSLSSLSERTVVVGVKQGPSSISTAVLSRPATSSFGTSKGEVVSLPAARRGWAIPGIAEVIGNARSLDYSLETLSDGERSTSFGEPSLDWKTDERIQRSCEAATSLRVAVLVSGGVDSSVALRLLCDAGHTCTAFYLKIWFQEDFENFWSACPWEEDLRFAQEVCDEAGVELKVVHLTDAYWGKVVSESISEIRAGRTPNPDMLCNSRIKFGEFLEHVKDEKFDRVASGHYALVKRIVSDNGEQLTQLHLSADEAKDQTYFLSQLSQAQLSGLMFPLGELTKVEVREVAAAMGLANKQRKDSQGICFLGKVKFSDFIARHLGEKEGCLLEAETGELLGTHKGFWFYTIGQRQGIGLSNGPWFVVAKDVDHNVVFVSRKYFTEKMRRSFRVGSFNWASGSLPSTLVNLRCKVRHGPRFYDCTVDFDASGFSETMRTAGSENISTAVVNLAEDDQGLAPGQYAAFYRDGVCLGSGIIFEALGEETARNVSAEALEVANLCNNPQFLKDHNRTKKNVHSNVACSCWVW
ncbi:unnamed protein product [Calypogeia fissa]